MLVLTLAGNSNRFFSNGYKIVKYKLPIGNSTIIEHILNYIPQNIKILIILNKKFNDFNYFNDLLINKGFENFKIVEVTDTQGQLETVYKGILEADNFVIKDDPITIFNGDTVRKLTNWEKFEGDGAIETFISDGDHWSFVDKLGVVNLVTEKKRISKYCSSGLYFFKSINLLIDNFNMYNELSKGNELYVAPFYNFLIKHNKFVTSFLVDKENFIFCGTPAEYELAVNL